METLDKTVITVNANVLAALPTVWNKWNSPEHVVHWNHASDDWHSPRAENDFRVGGRFCYRMEAKDGSFGFDFSGTYTQIIDHSLVAITLDDGRRLEVQFSASTIGTEITEQFEAEGLNSIDLQKTGWQAILNNFKGYVEKVQE